MKTDRPSQMEYQAVEPMLVETSEADESKIKEQLAFAREKFEHLVTRIEKNLDTSKEQRDTSFASQFEDLRMTLSSVEVLYHHFNDPNSAKEFNSKLLKDKNIVYENWDCEDSEVNVFKSTEGEETDQFESDSDDEICNARRVPRGHTYIYELKESTEYRRLETNFDYYLMGKPVYKFKINDIRALIQKETELKCKKFYLPREITARVKCDVKHDQFQLSIAYVNPEKIGLMETRMNTKFLIVLKRKETFSNRCGNTLFARYFPFEMDRVYGQYHPFFTFSYAENIKNYLGLNDDSITVHLHVKNCHLREDLYLLNRVFQWKIPVLSILQALANPAIDGEKEFGLSPFFFVDFDGTSIQIRLLLINLSFWAEVRYLNEEGENCFYPEIIFEVIHPTRRRSKIIFPFKPLADYNKRLPGNKAPVPNFVPGKSSYRFQFAKYHDFSHYLHDPDVFDFCIRVEM